MSIDIGRNMGDGFLPGNPTVEGILSRISTSGELPDAPPTQSQKEREALLEACGGKASRSLRYCVRHLVQHSRRSGYESQKGKGQKV